MDVGATLRAHARPIGTVVAVLGALTCALGCFALGRHYNGNHNDLKISLPVNYCIAGGSLTVAVLGGVGRWYFSSQSRHAALRQLPPLPAHLRNPSTPLDCVPVGMAATDGTHMPYNAEGVRDYGWGCAWRAIQTLLTSHKITKSFQDLWEFGSAARQKELYQAKYGRPLVPNMADGIEQPFAPHELVNGWAEPFTGEMVLFAHGINARLECVNGIPARATTPRSAFHRDPLTVDAFLQQLVDHHGFVMIDDGTTAMCITGARRVDDGYELSMADPHVKEAVPQGTGVYRIRLNAQGAQIGSSLLSDDSCQVEHLFTPQLFQNVRFDHKSWMVLFSTSR